MQVVRFESLYPADSREEEIKKILGFIKEGLSCQVIGLPGVGRANLLRFLAFNRNVRIRHLGQSQTNFHFLYLDFSEVKGKPLAEVHKFLFSTLVESFEERGFKKAHQEAEKLFRESLSLADPFLIFQNFKKTVDVLTNQLNLNLILLFDRFEEYLPALTSELFLNLHLLRNIAKYRFSVIFSLSRPLEKHLAPEVYQEFSEFLVNHHVFLPLYDHPEIEFRLSYLEKAAGKSLDLKIREKLILLTGGHGKLTKVGAESLLEAEKIASIEEFLSSQPDIQMTLAEIYGSLTTPEKNLAQKIAREENVEENEILDFLTQIDLVKKSGHDRFALTIPLLAQYLKTKAQDRREKIYFQPETKEIFKGDQVISDGFTAQEFRLLKFLLENPGRVCEREEIIRAVWPEAKSIEGVSDEAIDQMVFRLRKKTEDDPKNPQYLQTIKGRGFRFNP